MSEAAAVCLNIDLLEELGDEIATLSAHIHAATHRLLVLIARFDELRGWEADGHPNCARWLAVRTGIDEATAREKVRTARALKELPLTSAAMARGQLSFSKTRALTRVARPETERELLELACGATTAQLERIVRAWKQGSRGDEAEQERERHASHTFSVFPGDDGLYVVTGRLMPEVGALLMRAIEAASDALYRERRVAPDDAASDRQAAQRRADAVGLIAERALAAGFGASNPDAGAAEAPVSGTRAERYQVFLHVDQQALCETRRSVSAEPQPGVRVSVDTEDEPAREEADGATRVSAKAREECAELEDGTRVSAEAARRMCCDASVVTVKHRTDGSVLDVGRRTRTIPPALRRALEVRDRGCRFPGCGLRFTDGHHVRHWSQGGPTSLSNCLLLCAAHHRLVHEGGWRVVWWGSERPVFLDPFGREHFEGGWKPAALPEEPVSALIHGNRRCGVEPDAWTASARWEKENDIPADVYFAALEAG